MESKTLNEYLGVMSVLKDILQEDIGVVIADTTNIIGYRPGDTIDLNHKIGDRLLIEEPLYKTIKSGKGSSSIEPKEIFGILFKAVTYPIKDSQVHAVSQGQVAETEEITAVLEKITSDSQKLVDSAKFI
jgi:hypothetical protein